MDLEVPPSPSSDSSASEDFEVGFSFAGEHNDTISAESATYVAAVDHASVISDHNVENHDPEEGRVNDNISPSATNNPVVVVRKWSHCFLLFGSLNSLFSILARS